MSIRAIVFDIGGVILRTDDRSSRQALEKYYGLVPGELDQIVFDSPAARASTIGKKNEDAIWQDVAKRLSLTAEVIKKFKEGFWAGDRIDQTLISFLKDRRPEYITALLSNAWKNARATLASKYGITEGATVDHILISSELGVAKPDPEIYKILSETVNCEFSEILFVDDFIENINSARNLGIHSIHYKIGMNLVNKIESYLR